MTSHAIPAIRSLKVKRYKDCGQTMPDPAARPLTRQEHIVDTKGTDSDAILGDRRDELDALDTQLLDILRRRLECCVSIAQLKREHDIPMMQPSRVGVVQQRAEAFGQEHGISTDFLRNLYDVIITETCRVEDLIIDDVPTSNDNTPSR